MPYVGDFGSLGRIQQSDMFGLSDSSWDVKILWMTFSSRMRFGELNCEPVGSGYSLWLQNDTICSLMSFNLVCVLG